MSLNYLWLLVIVKHLDGLIFKMKGSFTKISDQQKE